MNDWRSKHLGPPRKFRRLGATAAHQPTSSWDQRAADVAANTRNRRRLSTFWCCGILPLLMLAFLGGLAPSGINAQEPIRFRRLFVPQDREAAWPRDAGVKYIPVPLKDFDRLVNLLSQGAEVPEGERRTRVSEAKYEARLDEQGVLKGTARFEISHHQPMSALLPLDPLGLAITADARGQTEATWTRAQPVPASLGVGPDGRFAVLVTESGTLEFSWSIQGQPTEEGGWRFTAALPHTPLATLEIDLPVGMQPNLGQGVLSRQSAAEGGRWQWHAELGSEPHLDLTLAPAQFEHQTSEATVRQSTRYELTPRGMQISATWTIDTAATPLKELELQLDPGVNLLEARQGDLVVPRAEADKQESGQPHRETLKFSTPLAGFGRTLRLTAIAPFEFGKMQRLPTLRAKGILWREGEAVLQISPSLSLQHLKTENCRQATPLTEGLEGQELKLQLFAANASVDVDVWYRPSRTSVAQATSLELTGSEIRGRSNLEFSQLAGDRFELLGAVGPHWTIDSIETEPPGGIADWSIDAELDDPAIRIRLAEPIVPANPLRMVVTGRWLESPVGQSLPLANLNMIQFAEATVTRDLLAVRAAAPDVLEFSQLPRDIMLEIADLKAEEQELLGDDRQGTLLRLDPRVRQGEVALRRQAPRFRASLAIDATVTPDSLWESYTLRVVPESGGLQRLIVQLSQPRTEELQWSWGSDAGDDDFAAVRLSAAQRVEAGVPSDMEAWRLTWQRARSTPFELRATRASSFAEREAVSLISLPEARRQDGRIHVWGFGTRNLGIESANLQAMHPEPVPALEASLQRAAFLYDPQNIPSAAALTLTHEVNQSGVASGLVWRGQMTSLWEPEGRAFHQGVYWVENIDSHYFRLSGLDGYEVERVELDGSHVEWERRQGDLLITLPSRNRFVTIAIQFSSLAPKSGLVTNIVPPQVQPAEFPQLRKVWQLWLPPGYGATGAAWHAETKPRTWWQRVFGSWVRPQHEHPFDPFATKDWERLANAFAKTQRSTAHPTQGDSSQVPASMMRTSNAAVAAQIQSPANVLAATPDAASGHLPWQASLGKFPVDRTLAWSSFEFTGENLESVTVVNETGIAALGWTLLILAAVVVWWLAPTFARFALILTGLALLLAALAPASISPLTTSLVQGALLGWALRFAVPSSTSQKFTRRRSQSGGLASALANKSPSRIVSAVLLLLAAAVGPQGFAQVLAQTVHKVFYPTDAEGDVVGEYCFVPDTLYAELHRRAARITREPREWSLRGANYRVLLQKSTAMATPAAAAVSPAAVTATFEMDIFRDRQQVRLDFGGSSPRRPADAVLGSDTIPVRWEDDGRYLLFEVPRSGTQRLELQLQPQVSVDNGRHSLELAIPRLPTARLEVLSPLSLPVQVASAVGEVRQQTESRPTVAQLGPTSRLALSWHPEPVEASSALFDVHELYWLQVKPGSVVVHCQFKSQFIRGATGTLRIAVDPRLRLLQPAQGVHQEDTDIPLGGDNPARRSIYRIDLQAGPLARDATAEVSFVFRDTTGVGRLQLPSITVLDARSTKRTLAASLDKSMTGRAAMVDSIESLPTNVFLSEWDREAAEPPTMAFRLHGPIHDWSLWAEPRETVVAADQSLRLSVGSSTVDVRFEARLATSGASLFRYRLRLPSGLKISEMNLREHDAVRPLRWSRETDGWVSVFLNKPATEMHLLQLVGTISLPRKAGVSRLAVPAIELDGVDVLSDVVEFYQKQGVELTVSAPLEDTLTGPGQVGPDRWLGRWWRASPTATSSIRRPPPTSLLPPGAEVGGAPSALQIPPVSASLDAISDTPAPALGETRGGTSREPRRAVSLPTAAMQIAPNNPRVQGSQTLWLQDANGAWQVGMDLQLLVRQGRLDELTFDIPASIDEPIQTSAEVKIELEPADLTTGRRRMVIRPLRSVQGAYRVQLTARLMAPAGQRLQAPDLRPLFAPALRRLVLLPTTWAGKPIAWQTQRLPRVDWPSDVQPPDALVLGPASGHNYEVYRVQPQPFQATLHSVESQRGQATVLLADICVLAEANGELQGVARFDLDPAGSSHCLVQLPPGFQLLHATVARLPATLKPFSASPEGGPILPDASGEAAADSSPSAVASDTAGDRPTVTGTAEASPGRWRLQLVSSRLVQRIEILFSGRGTTGRIEAPQLVDVSVERTLWTVQLPPSLTPVEGNLPSQSASTLDLARVRSLSEIIAAISFDESLEEMTRWYQPWVLRMQLALADLRNSARLENHRQALHEADIIDDFQRDVARQLGLETYFEQAQRGRTLAAESGSLWQATASKHAAFYAASEGPAPVLMLEWVDATAARRWNRYEAALAVLAALGLAALAMVLIRRLDISLASPQWLLAAAGIVWWLWLSPSFLGLVLVAISLLLSVPMGWRRHQRRELLRAGRL